MKKHIGTYLAHLRGAVVRRSGAGMTSASLMKRRMGPTIYVRWMSLETWQVQFTSIAAVAAAAAPAASAKSNPAEVTYSLAPFLKMKSRQPGLCTRALNYAGNESLLRFMRLLKNAWSDVRGN